MQKHYNYLTIDLDKKIYNKPKAVQGDSKSRYILVNLISNNVYYDLSNCQVKIYGVKKDKKVFFNDATIINAKQGQFEIELTNQALAVAGDLKLQLLILGSNQERLTSFAFFVEVVESIVSDSAIESSNEFNVLVGAFNKLEEWNGYFEKTSGQIEEKYAERLNKLDNKINTINSSKYIFIGDSYGEGYTPEGYVPSWCDFVKDLIGINDEDYYKYCKGGYGFTNGGFQELLNTSITEITDKENIKFVIIGGGYNDATNHTNIASGMKSFMDLCKSSYPNAKILVAPFGWCVEGLTTGMHIDQKTINLINMVLEYQRNAVLNNVGYVDGIYSVLHKNDFFSNDYVHPNQSGQYNIALALANYLQSGEFNTVEYIKDENVFANNVYENSISSDIKCIATVDGKNTNLNLSNGTIRGSFDSITLNGTAILLGTVKSAAINGCFSKILFKCDGVIKATDNTYHSANITLWINNNKLYMSIVLLDETKKNFQTLSFTEINFYSATSPITVNSLIN